MHGLQTGHHGDSSTAGGQPAAGNRLCWLEPAYHPAVGGDADADAAVDDAAAVETLGAVVRSTAVYGRHDAYSTEGLAGDSWEKDPYRVTCVA